MKDLTKIVTILSLFMFVDMIPTANSEPPNLVDDIELLKRNSQKNMMAASAACANAEKSKNSSVNQISSTISGLKSQLKLTEEMLNDIKKDTTNEKNTNTNDPNQFEFELDGSK